jgi:putative oxidoreductase
VAIESGTWPLRRIVDGVGRFFLVLLFLGSAVDNVTHSAKTAAIIGARGLPIPHLLAWATVLVEVVLSLALLFGIRSRVAALGLAAFTIVATTLFHLRPDSETEMHMFYKDIAIFGALLVIAMRQPPSSLAVLSMRHSQFRDESKEMENQ